MVSSVLAWANYLPKVRVLFATLEEHHPEWCRHLVLVEDESVALEPSQAGAHSVLTLADLGIPDWRPWSFCHRRPGGDLPGSRYRAFFAA